MHVEYVFCLTGDPSSRLQAINEEMTRAAITSSGKSFAIKIGKSCNIYAARNGCLAEMHSLKTQKPFGDMTYDKMIWVDSDNIVTPLNLNQLLAHDVDIVAAWYRQWSSGNVSDENSTACGYWDYPDSPGNIQPILMKEMLKKTKLFEVDYAGMGLMVVKSGVFETLQYPWFSSWVYEWEDDAGNPYAEIMTDDGGFCMKAKERGFKIWIDPKVKIAHEKRLAI